MNSDDKRLGMDRPITRRDFLNGVGIAVGAALLPACAGDNETPMATIAAYYPPLESGMRGSHPGSFEAAHATMQGKQWVINPSDEHYDLVVVGAGISGLAAAHIYRRDVDPNARILILDNHDDFGGHAKRNEFEIDGRTMIGFGGTMLMEAPRGYPNIAKQVLRDVALNVEDIGEPFQSELFEDPAATRACFLSKEMFGDDHLAVGSNGYSDALEDSALSASATSQLQRLFADEDDYLSGKSVAERRAILESISWREFLETYAEIDAEAINFIQKWPHGVWAIGADGLPAWMAALVGYPGFAGVDLGYWEDDGEEEDLTRFHFPDGNASIARLLVRHMVPGIADGATMDDIVMARFDYSKLDAADNATRIRLNSTVVDLRHRDGNLAGTVDVTYVTDGAAVSVAATKVIWAGYHAMLPSICPDVPAAQARAQRSAVRAPLVYTTVLLRNWQAFNKLGFWNAYCPGSFFQRVMLGIRHNIRSYQYPESPDEPMVVHLQHIPTQPGLSAAEQFRAGRRQLLQRPFEEFERHVRDQFGRMLGPAGFDPATDIEAITVNRWPHGYAYSTDPESGDVAWWPEMWKHERRPWEDARAPIGNISIAGTDASSNAMTESAIQEAHRAVNEII
ncbi:MAG: FAD/NAD(P)-binding protein [Pseudomonadota bacterium]